jgi:tetratricopeptide (TPR) repeat protein
MTRQFVSHYTPSLLPKEALEETFVQREQLAQRLVALTTDCLQTGSTRNVMLVGPRGIGKTHLISLLYYRIRALEADGRSCVMAWLREEEWGVSSFVELLMRILRALEECQPGITDGHAADMVYGLAPADRARAAADIVLRAVKGRVAVILCENMDSLFEGIGPEGQKRLRSLLQENPSFVVIGTSQALFRGVSARTSPFYGFFEVVHLKPLTVDEASLLLSKLASARGESELVSFIASPKGRARVRAINHFANGNHRVYMIFSHFLSRDSLDDLVDPFMQMVDGLTPHYQARMASLPLQQRKIVEYLCECRRAAPVKEIAERCFVSQQTASSQLGTLTSKGYVRSKGFGRRSHYELTEPLMRLAVEVKRHRGEPIRLFVDFLRIHYTYEELRNRLEICARGNPVERTYIECAMREARASGGDPVVDELAAELTERHDRRDYDGALKYAEALVDRRGSAADYCLLGDALWHLHRLPDALSAFENAARENPRVPEAWSGQAAVLREIGRLDDGETAANRALDLDTKNVVALIQIVAINIARGDHAAVLRACDKLLAVAPTNRYALGIRAATLTSLERWNEVLPASEAALRADRRDASARVCRIKALRAIGRKADARRHAMALVRHTPSTGFGCFVAAEALMDIGMPGEALEMFDDALARGGPAPCVAFHRAAALLALHRWRDATLSIRDALDATDASAECIMAHTINLVNSLYPTQDEPDLLRPVLKGIVGEYGAHGMTGVLAAALVEWCGAAFGPRGNARSFGSWLTVWREVVGGKREFDLPIRLFGVAIELIETQTTEAMMRLPTEERLVLEEILKRTISEGGWAAGAALSTAIEEASVPDDASER